MLLVIGVLAAIVLIIVARKKEIITHDPLEGARQRPGGAADPRALLELFKEGKQADALALFEKMKQDAGSADAEEEDLDPELEEALTDLIDEDRLPEAVQLYQRATGADLAAAKRFIDELRSGQ